MPLNLFNDRALTCTDVVASEPSFRAIQGYSLVGHGRKNVWLGLMRFQAQDERKAELRAFLKQFGSK